MCTVEADREEGFAMYGHVIAAEFFAGEPESARIARNFAVDVYRKVADVDHELLRLLVSEAVTNAVVHAGGDVQVICHAPHEGRVQLEVHDRGPGLPMRRTPSPGESNGRGLLIFEALEVPWVTRETYSGKSFCFTLEGERCLA